jgi:hypothetical protein
MPMPIGGFDCCRRTDSEIRWIFEQRPRCAAVRPGRGVKARPRSCRSRPAGGRTPNRSAPPLLQLALERMSPREHPSWFLNLLSSRRPEGTCSTAARERPRAIAAQMRGIIPLPNTLKSWAGATGPEPAPSGVTGRAISQINQRKVQCFDDAITGAKRT